MTEQAGTTSEGRTTLWIEVFLNLPLFSSFFYRQTPSGPQEKTKGANKTAVPAQTGCRAQVMFGNRRMTAFIVGTYKELPSSIDFPVEKIREIGRVIDEKPLFTEELIRLALWMESYYLCGRGEALSAMLPSGKREAQTSLFSADFEAGEFEAHPLSNEQQTAVDAILSEKKHLMHYLYGSTGSGKTEVFLRLADKTLAEDKGVIYLVPEIGLTKQVIDAVTGRFGETAAVLHSGLTGSEKLAQWRRIAEKKARVVIGARSAVFAPVPDLGLIIIDEEHDSSYKSGNSPRYSARQIAMKRCADCAIPLVMGSATPSVEAWHLMRAERICEHRLTKRLAGGAMPSIEIVDLGSSSEDAQTDGCISRRLEREIRAATEDKKQTILFLNRRGFTHFFRCKTCGFDLKCKNCSTSLTYHKKAGVLRCHYCGLSVRPPSECPSCSSLDIEYTGFGTEFIEEEIRAKFPHARVIRADSDSLDRKDDLVKKLEAFKAGEADILLGTQMVAKGLNFPRVRLVGVISADTGLHLPDFRAAERTFSLIVQVAGRAGRFFPDGKVIVQTYNPENKAVALACKGLVEEFYREELEERRQLDFPPYSRLVRLVFRSADEAKAEAASEEAAEIIENIRQSAQVRILGPAECPIEKIAANHRRHILLRAKRIGPLQETLIAFLSAYKNRQGVYIEVDVDPVSLL
ncbi:primosomal protein N' [Treponema sp. HNW]|uniref:replication restart helicase PriA n=1 Tax=Treponema sp. HNW TaxID=3116654 RepID=UPI003D141731